MAKLSVAWIFAASLVLALLAAYSRAGAPQTPMINAEDRAKIEFLKGIMIESHRAPQCWAYKIVDLPSAKAEATLNRLGRTGFELVCAEPLVGRKVSRFTLKKKIAGNPE